MGNGRRTIGRVVSGLMLAVTLGGCAAFDIQPSSTVTSLSPAWPNWFRVDFAVDQDKTGKRRISGYVHNDYGEHAGDIRLLTQALDKSGAVLAQQINWVAPIAPLSRTYFEVRNLPEADQYRVSVWAFTFQIRDGWM